MAELTHAHAEPSAADILNDGPYEQPREEFGQIMEDDRRLWAEYLGRYIAGTCIIRHCSKCKSGVEH